MKAVLMRVRRASVTIDERETRSIGRGFLILLAVTHDDTEAQAVKLADKLCSLRLFEDADGKINLTLDEVGGEIMIVSQFTLYGNCRKGRRPEFQNATRPEAAEPHNGKIVNHVRARGRTGENGGGGDEMAVDSVNDGPFTLIVDTKDLEAPK